jgi:hypothetical protein
VAGLERDGDDLVIVLTALEKAEAVHGDVRVPWSSVTGIEVVEDVVHAVPGWKVIGSAWPGRFAIGTFDGGSDKVRGVKVRLQGAHYDEVVVSCADPESVVSELGPVGR